MDAEGPMRFAAPPLVVGADDTIVVIGRDGEADGDVVALEEWPVHRPDASLTLSEAEVQIQKKRHAGGMIG
jgi:hypothetical protein